jgi:adenylate cyclase
MMKTGPGTNADMQAFLILNHNGETRQIPCLDIMTFGREDGCDVVLPDQRVSRKHAMLYRTQDNSYYLADEGSANGSFVNAVRISFPTRLNDGDQISIGAFNLRFRQPGVARRVGEPGDDRHRTTVIVPQSVELLRIAILVADIRGFTRMSEAIPVRQLTELMNEWFREATECIRAHDGLVDKFLGDCVYARWEANRDPAAALLRVLGAACELNRITARLNDAHPELPQPLRIGVGINIGNAALGTEQGQTAIGDAVNLTFRLQEKTKQLGCDILLNRDAYLNLPPERWQGHEQTLSVAGKTQPLEVWGLSFKEVEHLLAGPATGTPR